MSFATQALRYGWVALASLGALTGTTIYVLNNQRHQVKPEDIIELVLGTVERCHATKNLYFNDEQGRWDDRYGVHPPTIEQTWYSNVYMTNGTNGVAIYTNIVTNTIGWRIDQGMMMWVDTAIKALVPFYVNTNTIALTTTNFVFDMLTVTGLWAELQIGDRTNRFTSEPAWTNTVTNWIVNYTSYWPSTNGVGVTNCYTSDYQQVANYAESWTATGGHVWVSSSNWVSTVVTVTNAATYDKLYTWQIYAEGLEERYKVLNALRTTRLPSLWTCKEAIIGVSDTTNETAAAAKANAWNTRTTSRPPGGTPAEMFFYAKRGSPPMWEAYCELNRQSLNTNALSTTVVFAVTACYVNIGAATYVGGVFHDFGAGYIEDQVNKIEYPFIIPPGDTWVEDWPPLTEEWWSGWGFETALEDFRKTPYCTVDWQFNYCTNKYW